MRKVYLDNAATTPLLPEVREAMLPFLGEAFGNPSCLHSWGDAAREAVDNAREQVAQLIGGDAEEIIFTASGTESNNFAVKGLALAQQNKGKHVVVSAIEHFSVLHSARTLEKSGFEVSLVPVDRYGLVDPDDVRKNLRKDTTLVSIMHATGEVGTIEPIKEIAKITKEEGLVFHTDAVAIAGTIPVDVKELGIDALSLAGNQFYGPKGVGALWVQKECASCRSSMAVCRKADGVPAQRTYLPLPGWARRLSWPEPMWHLEWNTLPSSVIAC